MAETVKDLYLHDQITKLLIRAHEPIQFFTYKKNLQILCTHHH
jgi:hypothetical protein